MKIPKRIDHEVVLSTSEFDEAPGMMCHVLYESEYEVVDHIPHLTQSTKIVDFYSCEAY